jgi:serine/threonine protein kinase
MDAYDVLDKIGHGAFGEVFRARRVTTGETVAIKKLRLNDDGRLRVLPAALFQEIETLRQLDHVHVRTARPLHGALLMCGGHTIRSSSCWTSWRMARTWRS